MNVRVAHRTRERYAEVWPTGPSEGEIMAVGHYKRLHDGAAGPLRIP